MDFANYSTFDLAQVSGGVYTLARGLIPEIAYRFGHTLRPEPTEQDIRGLIGAIAPHKQLKLNREYVLEVLGSDAVNIAADWLEGSSIMDATYRPFCAPTIGQLPEHVDYAIWQGGVANWQLRRLMAALRLSPVDIDLVVLPTGNAQMKPDEHQLVKSWITQNGQPPTQQQFVQRFAIGVLELAWFNAKMLPVDSEAGRDVYTELVTTYPDILDGTVLAVGNAPATIQVAGQFRAWARKKRPDFDASGDQLLMVGDHFSVARRGQAAADCQDPLTGIGALLRAALYVHRAIEGAV